MAHRRVGAGLLFLIVYFIPLLNLISLFYFGVKGNEIAVDSNRFEDETRFVKVQNAWRNWAIGLTIALIILNVALAVLGSILNIATHRSY